MRNVTITLEENVVSRARVEAAKQGKSLSRFVSELVERQVGRPLSQREALDRFLAGPLMDLTDGDGRAPKRDDLYK